LIIDNIHGITRVHITVDVVLLRKSLLSFNVGIFQLGNLYCFREPKDLLIFEEAAVASCLGVTACVLSDSAAALSYKPGYTDHSFLLHHYMWSSLLAILL